MPSVPGDNEFAEVDCVLLTLPSSGFEVFVPFFKYEWEVMLNSWHAHRCVSKSLHCGRMSDSFTTFYYDGNLNSTE